MVLATYCQITGETSKKKKPQTALPDTECCLESVAISKLLLDFNQAQKQKNVQDICINTCEAYNLQTTISIRNLERPNLENMLNIQNNNECWTLVEKLTYIFKSYLSYKEQANKL